MYFKEILLVSDCSLCCRYVIEADCLVVDDVLL